jgi:two-component system response regulator QseB
MKQREEQTGLILLVEDNRGISEMVGEYLERRGYSVDYAADGVTGLHLAVTNSYDVIVLDLMLPGLDGIELCRKLRADGKKSTPVLMLTARDTLEDKLVGLDAGADDYLIKPFDLDELAARVRALLRRRTGQKQPVYAHGELTLDPAAHEVTKSGESLPLVPREFALLQALIEEPTRVFTKAELEEKLYGWGEEVGSNTIEVHVHSLRRKIGAEQVVTVRGVGYRLKRC